MWGFERPLEKGDCKVPRPFTMTRQSPKVTARILEAQGGREGARLDAFTFLDTAMAESTRTGAEFIPFHETHVYRALP